MNFNYFYLNIFDFAHRKRLGTKDLLSLCLQSLQSHALTALFDNLILTQSRFKSKFLRNTVLMAKSSFTQKEIL